MLLGNETVVRLRAPEGGTDRYGNETADWDEAAELAVTGCLVAPWESEDVTSPTRKGIAIGLQVYAPSGSDIEARDRIRARGDVYDIDGEVADWRSPTGTVGGLHVRLRRVRG